MKPPKRIYVVRMEGDELSALYDVKKKYDDDIAYDLVEEGAVAKEQLITKQQLQIEELETAFMKNKNVMKSLYNKFYAIGQPLNDNVLKFDRRQLLWCVELLELINEWETEI